MNNCSRPPDTDWDGVRIGARDLGVTALPSTRAALLTCLEKVETALGCAPDEISLLLEQARCLHKLGQSWRARGVYLAILNRDRYDCEAMLGLAELYIASGEFVAAQTVLSEAVLRHSTSVATHSTLGTVFLELDNLAAAQSAFMAALQLNPLHRKAWCGLAVVFERKGETDAADLVWREAFREVGPPLSVYRGSNEPVRVLLLWSAVDGNIPLKPVLDDAIFQWATFFVESYCEDMTLPPHDVVLNAVGEPDLPTRALMMAQQIVRASSAAVVNHPSRVQTTTRQGVSDRLRSIPGVVTPRMIAVPRNALASSPEKLLEESSLRWPLLVRSLGFHTGKHFVLVERPADLKPAIAKLPGEELLVIAFLDTRGPDGNFRKYRVMFIDGKLYPLHLAISREWMVHYYTAQMSTAEYRAEEAEFLADFRGVIGAQGVAALEQVRDELGLDYGGVDFSLDHRGRLVIFEANATMTVRIPPAGHEWDYARPAAERIQSAVRDMLLDRARSTRPA